VGLPRFARLLTAAALLAASPARADEPADPYAQHLASAARLVEEENHAAARAEFEAAYRAQPKPGALLGMALCDKALFRYPQAMATLERVLADPALDAAERRTAEEALAEMKALLGFVQVVLVPAGATLRIDGEDQPAGAANRTLPLAAGSHRLEARFPGHAPAAQTITLASGETAAVKLRLVPGGDSAVTAPAGARGPYLLAAASVFVPLPPADFSGTGVGVAVGARVGYRFLSVLGGELGFEYAHVAAAGQGKPSLSDVSGATYKLGYELSCFRFGAHVRLMTPGERVRFVQILGGGVMADSIGWEPGAGTPARQNAKGADGFGISETGFEVDLRGGLIGLTLQQIVGGSGGLEHPRQAGEVYATGAYGGPQYAIGLGLRGGYRLW
jgi:hypothetical protein